MDYEKKYNEALERAKKFEEKYGGGYAEYIFPELVESDDERIRMELVAFFKAMQDDWHEKYWHDLEIDRILAYLEKQKEQKPVSISCGHENDAEWSEEDERKRLACIETINEVIDYERERWEDYNPGKPYRPIMKYDEQVDWLKSLRPSWKPSEEQMSYLLSLHQGGEEQKPLRELIEQLKKL